ncbi:MAG: hypothetical protein JWN99_1216 [Ilumatobacteraceae bacterium]|nr:hypothetical protein [Ilumatobacteraceae bacterium]
MAAGLILMTAGPLAACADGEAAKAVSNELDVVDGSAPGGSAGDQQVMAQATGVVCEADHTTMQTAIDVFEATMGRLPTSQAELVDAQLLREPSTTYDMTAAGALVPAAGSTCT